MQGNVEKMLEKTYNTRWRVPVPSTCPPPRPPPPGSPVSKSTFLKILEVWCSLKKLFLAALSFFLLRIFFSRTKSFIEIDGFIQNLEMERRPNQGMKGQTEG